MTKETVKEIYIEACRVKGRSPDRPEADQWAKQFELCDASDLRSAVNAWWADTTPTSNGQPRGKFFPQPVELKPLVNAAYTRRLAQASIDKLFAVWRCETCRVSRSGFIESNDFQRRYCQGVPRRASYKRGEICGGTMIEILREAYRSDDRAA